MGNQDIREMMKEKHVTAYALAAVMGVSENTLFRKLRYELSDEEKEEYINAINLLSKSAEKAHNSRLLRTALRELYKFQAKYSEVKELQPVFQAITEVMNNE